MNEQEKRLNKKQIFTGIDIGGTYINIGLLSNDAKIIIEKKIKFDTKEKLNFILKRIRDTVNELIRKTDKNYEVCGIGVGTAGLVDKKRGYLYQATNLPVFSNIELGKLLQKLMAVNVVIDNDANLAALGEFKYGAGRGANEMIMLTLGSGVGSGLIIDGSIYRGPDGVAGELGHTTIQKDGPQCVCGKKGCLEAFLGKYGLLRAVYEKFALGETSSLQSIINNGKEITPKHISLAAANGDEVAQKVLQTAGEALGVGIANVVNLLNIKRFVIGGGIAKAGDLLLEPARKIVDEFAFRINDDKIEVVTAQLGEHAGIIGAAHLAMIEFNSKK